MGIVETALHSESLGAVSSFDGCYSEGILGKPSMKNDDCSYLAAPKYRWWRMAVSRDFPTGCGQYAPRMNLREYEDAACIDSVENLVVGQKNGCVLGVDCVKASTNEDECQSLRMSSEETINENHPLRRRVSAIRTFPPFCGNAPRLSKEENQIVITSLKRKNLEQTGEYMKDIDAQENKLEGSVSRLSGDTVQAHFERNASKASRKQDELTTSSEVKFPQYHEKEKRIKATHHKSLTIYNKNNNDVGYSKENVLQETAIYRKQKIRKKKLSDLSDCHNDIQEEDFEDLKLASDVMIVQGLMAGPSCSLMQVKGSHVVLPAGIMSERKGKTGDSLWLDESKTAFARKEGKIVCEGNFVKRNSQSAEKAAYQGNSQVIIRKKKHSSKYDDGVEDFDMLPRSQGIDVNLRSFSHRTSTGKDNDCDVIAIRNKVRETLRLFQAVCRKLLQEEEAKYKERGNTFQRIDLQAARILKGKGKFINTGKQILGCVPGVEVGDEFHYRVELNIIGLHRQTQAGIDFLKQGAKILCTSIVASGGYADDLDNPDFLIYTGSGGNVKSGDKMPEDQKLERGNLALKNSIDAKNSVRVILGFREPKASDSSEARAKIVVTYTYDGLYLVEKCWQELGPHGKLVYKYLLSRIPGQPSLAWKEVKNSKKCKVREGLCVNDISHGKESIPICAVNTIDNQKPPPFKYVTGVIYPDWCHPISPKGCNCINGCSNFEKCSCVVKNGGGIPYNCNGAIVEAKPVVYECGPSCKCPPSCYNRVSQHGIKFQLEIFKTESRGWGVRSLSFIPSGSFICEYIGELLEDTEAERRTGNDEYLFDIGNNYSDGTLWDGFSTLVQTAKSSSCGVVEDGGFTIDAAQRGNVGRFINHSCSPNLYAQDVLYDHEDKRIPHIMLFAAENIPPLKELTYHYNYKLDQVHDSMGNIKKKSCFCGSPGCIGRMY